MPDAEPGRPLTVAITGASGYIAGRLIDHLTRDPSIGRVLGFDVRPARVAHPKFVFDIMDARSEALERRFRGVDVVVHLAFIMDPIKDEAEMRDVNVNGTQNVLRCAGRAGVAKVVYTSSATVYGAHPDNPVPLDETSPLRANLDFSYSAHKLEAEYVVREFTNEFSDRVVTVLRPAIVFGDHVDNAWSHLLESPVLIGVQGHLPPIQFVHEDDVGRALHFAVSRELAGAYNLAAPGWLRGEDALAIVARRRVELPEPAAFAVLDRLWRLGLAEAPAGMLHYLMYPWVVATDKLAAAGFSPQRSNHDILASVAQRSAPYVRVGTRRLRRKDLARGGGAALGLAGAVLGRSLIRKMREAA